MTHPAGQGSERPKMTPDDDAVHIASPVSGAITLCQQRRERVRHTVSMQDQRPNSGVGCWTCLQRAAAIEGGLTRWLESRS